MQEKAHWSFQMQKFVRYSKPPSKPGLMTMCGCGIGNKERGDGRSDVIVYAPSEGQAAVFEIKYSKDVESLSKDCNAALRQIDTRMYAKELEDDYDHVVCYGISFFKKRCVIRKKS